MINNQSQSNSNNPITSSSIPGPAIPIHNMLNNNNGGAKTNNEENKNQTPQIPPQVSLNDNHSPKPEVLLPTNGLCASSTIDVDSSDDGSEGWRKQEVPKTVSEPPYQHWDTRPPDVGEKKEKEIVIVDIADSPEKKEIPENLSKNNSPPNTPQTENNGVLKRKRDSPSSPFSSPLSNNDLFAKAPRTNLTISIDSDINSPENVNKSPGNITSTPSNLSYTASLPGLSSNKDPVFRKQISTSEPIVDKKTKSETNGTHNTEDDVVDTLLVLPKTNHGIPECDPDFASRVNLDPVPDSAPLPKLTPKEVAELEHALQIGDEYSNLLADTTWREDWNGNLQLFDKEIIMNREKVRMNSMTKVVLISFDDWVFRQSTGPNDFRGIQLLFSYIYHMTDTPPMARKILAYVLQRKVSSVSERQKTLIEAVRRISYDPTVLVEDAWTTAKADSPDGASGGAFLIGRRVIWEREEAIVIAFVRDEEIGDLWKAMWFDDKDTFDLEADELQEAMKKWERKYGVKNKRANAADKGAIGKRSSSKGTASIRFEASRNFTVDGVENGIILAMSYKGRRNIFWPARIMHVSEVKALGHVSSRRSSSKNEIHVVFLAPYWDSGNSSKGRSASGGSNSTRDQNAKNPFSTGPLFELETIDVSSDTIKKYPFDNGDECMLSIDKLRTQFSFLGLPKSAFPRYLDSHRIAYALKAYAQKESRRSSPSLTNQASHAEAFASLTDTHPLSIRTWEFPSALLNLPFDYILSHFETPAQQGSQMIRQDEEECKEQVMDLHGMMKSLKPPYCYNKKSKDTRGKDPPLTPSTISPAKLELPAITSPTINKAKILSLTSVNDTELKEEDWKIEHFAAGFFVKEIGSISEDDLSLKTFNFIGRLSELILQLKKEVEKNKQSGIESQNLTKRKNVLRSLLASCLTLKTHGEDTLYSSRSFSEPLIQQTMVTEWRKACERVYKATIIGIGSTTFGHGVTGVITDSRCNQHITANGSYERPVRLPAAIRAAKLAGAGGKANMPLIIEIEDKYIDVTETKVLEMAHNKSYLKRIREKIAALPPDAKGTPLTDDSDGEGGEDTMGSKGSYLAAVVGVAAAIKAVDKVVTGQCVNTFCAIRPPGHHAGRALHAMKAVSNGFCIFNAAACAALYATLSIAEGGLGLRRVCVIDIDVHHGNGTQDILCSTYDPRFLYISTHAGGAHINGFDEEDSDGGIHRSLYTSKSEGIFPGRCGDTSPHPGVLNIPLGKKVTPQAVGNALVCQVTPAVEKFCPDLIIISAGFDAHQNDPLGMGGLSAEDYNAVTKVICQMATKVCSGRLLSLLEGGYGVPCCRLPNDLFLPGGSAQQPGLPKIMNLGTDLPDSMEDNVDPLLLQKLNKCHQEGFLECVKEHVSSLAEHSEL